MNAPISPSERPLDWKNLPPGRSSGLGWTLLAIVVFFLAFFGALVWLVTS